MKNINLDKEDQAYYCGKYSEKEVLQFIAKLEVQKKVENWFTVTEDDLHLIANMTIEEIEEVWQGVDFEVHKEDMEYLVNLPLLLHSRSGYSEYYLGQENAFQL